MPALASFEGNSKDELTIVKGEYMEVVERHETGWTFGKKKFNAEHADHHQLEEGWFPDWVIKNQQA